MWRSEAGKLAKISSLLTSGEMALKNSRSRPIQGHRWGINYNSNTNEQREGSELVEQFNLSQSDTQGVSSDASPFDARSDDTRSLSRVLEPFDSSTCTLSLCTGILGKLGHSNYFRLSLLQCAGTTSFVADGDCTFGDKGQLKLPKPPACYALKSPVV